MIKAFNVFFTTVIYLFISFYVSSSCLCLKYKQVSDFLLPPEPLLQMRGLPASQAGAGGPEGGRARP